MTAVMQVLVNELRSFMYSTMFMTLQSTECPAEQSLTEILTDTSTSWNTSTDPGLQKQRGGENPINPLNDTCGLSIIQQKSWDDQSP